MPTLHIGQWLREISCQHLNTATQTQAFSNPHPHVTSRTVCLDCGRAVSPRSPVPDDVIHKMLASAVQKSKALR